MKTLVILLLNFLTLQLFAQTWEQKTDLPADLAFPVVVELNGNIHVIGGGASGGATDLHLRYSPQSNRWDTLPPVPYKAQQPAGAAVNGKIHFCGGGFPNTGTRLNKHYYYDSDSSKWFAAADLPVATAIHKAVSFDNKFYIFSGQPNKTLCQYFNPDSNVWVTKKALPDGNFWYGAMTSNSKGIYRFGGGGFGAPFADAHFYDQSKDQWRTLPSLPNPLHAAAATSLNDSLILISGGYYSGLTYNKTYIFNTRNELYYPSNSLPFGTNYHSMVSLGNCAYFLGGNNDDIPNAGTANWVICDPEYKWSVKVKSVTNSGNCQLMQTTDEIILKINPTEEIPSQITLFSLNGSALFSAFPGQETNVFRFTKNLLTPGVYLIRFVSDNIEYHLKVPVY
ncbi:MAG: hypothetical protein H6605_02195 [Flavobacteriales bacterium]|nr:hypothetical protein [Flavobacteriales bacterium]